MYIANRGEVHDGFRHYHLCVDLVEHIFIAQVNHIGDDFNDDELLEDTNDESKLFEGDSDEDYDIMNSKLGIQDLCWIQVQSNSWIIASLMGPSLLALFNIPTRRCFFKYDALLAILDRISMSSTMNQHQRPFVGLPFIVFFISVLFGISRFLNSTAALARVLGGASSNATIPYQTLYRLLYRRKQRGILELDLVLGSLVENHIGSLDVKGSKSLITVLNLENPDLWKWLTGQEQPP
ncbi:unnamed protein product [Lactuca saligna]|uniref:WDR11 first beta-propeller domain-containing protein n=1 Tax=Lactuca saligna TaxID=75948 RepID=A0AA36A2G5_LACSI|nr:unnamed protein product [Lactuca saligna]